MPLACFWKQARHSTGLPWVGLNGTVVSRPQAEQVVRVSERTRPPLARFALHCLQCLGSFLNCLSWKKSCSPAVKTNSAPQSLHFNTLSTNSMTGFPKTGTTVETGHDHESLPFPFPCFHVLEQQGPGPPLTERLYCSVSPSRETELFRALLVLTWRNLE